jgi:hypothetical protein
MCESYPHPQFSYTLWLCQWPFHEPKLQVPTIYKAYFSGLCTVREYPHKIWPYMVQYLHFRILKFPLIIENWNYWNVWGVKPKRGENKPQKKLRRHWKLRKNHEKVWDIHKDRLFLQGMEMATWQWNHVFFLIIWNFKHWSVLGTIIYVRIIGL